MVGSRLKEEAGRAAVGAVGTVAATTELTQKAVEAAGTVAETTGSVIKSSGRVVDTAADIAGTAANVAGTGAKVVDTAATLLDRVSTGTGDVAQAALQGTAKTLGPLTDTVAFIARLPITTIRGGGGWWRRRRERKMSEKDTEDENNKVEKITEDIMNIFNQEGVTEGIRHTYVAWTLHAAKEEDAINESLEAKIILSLQRKCSNNRISLDINAIQKEKAKIKEYFSASTPAAEGGALGGGHHHKKSKKRRKTHKKKRSIKKRRKHTRKKKKSNKRKKTNRKF